MHKIIIVCNNNILITLYIIGNTQSLEIFHDISASVEINMLKFISLGFI